MLEIHFVLSASDLVADSVIVLVEIIGIDSKEKALLVLNQYETHFPTSQHTVGGIYNNVVEMESSETTTSSELMKAFSSELSVSASISAKGFGYSASFSKKKIQNHMHPQANYTKEIKCSYYYTTVGPKTENITDFCTELFSNPDSWAVIDRGILDPYNLVSHC